LEGDHRVHTGEPKALAEAYLETLVGFILGTAAAPTP
jgi:hypothetical protein